MSSEGCIIKISETPDLYVYSNVITFLSTILSIVDDDDRLSQMYDTFVGLHGLPIGCYDKQPSHVTIVNPGRTFTEAVYSIRYRDEGEVLCTQPIDFLPLFYVTQPETGDDYVLVHSNLTSPNMLQYIRSYIQKMCNPSTHVVSNNIAAGYSYLPI